MFDYDNRYKKLFKYILKRIFYAFLTIITFQKNPYWPLQQ